MPSVSRIKGKVIVIDNCEFRAKIALYRRDVSSGSDFRYSTKLTKIRDLYAVYDSTGASVPYFDRVNNINSGITDYFYIKKSSLAVDKRYVVEYSGNRYNVSGITDLGHYLRLNCSLTGSSDKAGSIV